MGTIKVTSQTLNTNFTYENESLSMTGSYQQDKITGNLVSISGTCYKPVEGQSEYVGNFNGRMKDGEMKYSLSDMSRQDTVIVLDAIDEIEQYIKDQE
jgi:hypothetical protein